ncbi:MAG: class I SAM-dependent methyltransferase [Firmicutes bacterium]|nr:class I SAM-dependent methyltransferase [Bacillota bacterium]
MSEKELQDVIIKNWTDAAKGYSDAVRNELNSSQRDEWVKLIFASHKPKQRLKILDVGCGPGFFSILMAQEGHQVTGIDATEEMIKYAKMNAERWQVNPEFYVMDSHHTKFDDDSFDLIISRNVTWTLSDPEAAYRDWLRILKPDGTMIAFDANWNHHLFDEEQNVRYQQDVLDYEKTFGKKAEHYHGKSKEEGEAYRRQMPMNQVIRPQWDFPVLIDSGYRKITVDLDVSPKVYCEEKQCLNRSRPMFMIRAIK